MAANILNVQFIDQRVAKRSEELGQRLREEAKLPDDPHKLKSIAFVCLVSSALLDLDDDEVIDGIVEGGGDFGVDAVYWSPPSDGEFVVTLVQGKYKKSLDGTGNFPETGIIKLMDAIRTIFNPNSKYTANERLTKRVEDVRSIIADGNYPTVRAILCNNGVRWSTEAQQRINESGFGDTVTWEHVGPDELRMLMRPRVDVDAQITLSGKAVVEDHTFMRAMIGRMSVVELAKIFNQHGDVLLERNIRRYLGLSGRVNEEIASTLRNQQQRPRFYFYNNGITLICSKFSYNAFSDRDWMVKLSGVQIVNGGQTSRTIQLVMRELGPEISNAHVLVRIYELPDDDEDLVQKITRATNSQNPVDLRDLRSNDAKQRQLEEMILELGYHFRRKRSDGSSTSTELTNSTVAEAVLAVWRQRPHQARFLATEHFGKLYDQIFTNDLNGAQAVLAVLLLRFAENKRKRPPEGSPNFLQYGSRFVAMLMGKYLVEELEIKASDLTHLNFSSARQKFDACSEMFYLKALDQIQDALSRLYAGQDLSLQRLSAAFRRGDMVSQLIGHELEVPTLFRP